MGKPMEVDTVVCTFCGSTVMPVSDWMKHKKGKKHRGNVAKSGSTLEEANRAVEGQGAAAAGQKQGEEVERPVDAVFLKLKVAHPPNGDGRKRYLSAPNVVRGPEVEDAEGEGEEGGLKLSHKVVCHEYANAAAGWRFAGPHIRHAVTGHYLVAHPTPRDANSSHLTFTDDPGTQAWKLLADPTDNRYFTVLHSSGMTLAAAPAARVSLFSVQAILHKCPNRLQARWCFHSIPNVDQDRVFRGRIKMYSPEEHTGFIECDEAHSLFDRDVFIDENLLYLCEENVRKEVASDSDSADSGNALHGTRQGDGIVDEIVDFRIKLDEGRGMPVARRISRVAPVAATAWRHEAREVRRFKKLKTTVA